MSSAWEINDLLKMSATCLETSFTKLNTAVEALSSRAADALDCEIVEAFQINLVSK